VTRPDAPVDHPTSPAPPPDSTPVHLNRWRLPALAAGAVAGGVATWLILDGRNVLAGMLAALAVVGVRAGSPPDALRSTRTGFVASLLDRCLEAALLVAIAWTERGPSPRSSVLALVCLGASYLEAYEVARGRALGYRLREWVGYRATALAVVPAGLLLGLVEPSLWILAVLTLAASAVRAADVARQSRAESPVVGTP
jgi:hypothetical protein